MPTTRPSTTRDQELSPTDALPQADESVKTEIPLRERLQAMLDRMEAEAGPISPEVQAEVDALDWPE